MGMVILVFSFLVFYSGNLGFFLIFKIMVLRLLMAGYVVVFCNFAGFGGLKVWW